MGGSDDDPRRWLDRLDRPDAHAAAFAATPALHAVEEGGTGSRPGAASLRVVAWNLERGRFVDEAARVLARAGADVVLATELDVGMARSANRHTPADLAAALGHTFAFGVEFVELGPGDAAERERVGTTPDRVGHHGNAILSSVPLIDPEIVRIEAGGSWFRPDTDQPRIGGRMAVVATVALGATPVTLASVHLESESDPALRAEQLTVVLDAVDARNPDGPAVLGGDLNTFSASQGDFRTRFGDLNRADRSRWNWPVPYEPLFALAAARGFAVETANRPEPTVRLAGGPKPGLLPRLDWLLVRGLEATDPATIPALGPDGTVLTDHDAIAVTVRLRGDAQPDSTSRRNRTTSSRNRGSVTPDR